MPRALLSRLPIRARKRGLTSACSLIRRCAALATLGATTLGVPDYLKAKAAEIASNLPNATFDVDELRSSERVYDPFLVVSYGDETYYVVVWDEPVIERQHT